MCHLHDWQQQLEWNQRIFPGKSNNGFQWADFDGKPSMALWKMLESESESSCARNHALTSLNKRFPNCYWNNCVDLIMCLVSSISQHRPRFPITVWLDIFICTVLVKSFAHLMLWIFCDPPERVEWGELWTWCVIPSNTFHAFSKCNFNFWTCFDCNKGYSKTPKMGPLQNSTINCPPLPKFTYLLQGA